MKGNVAVETARFVQLDAWRGLAALSVLLFHSVNTLVGPGQSWLTDALRQGWAGVYVFFPISGYCILAASHSRANASVGLFLKRRWRRIFPTYWASVLVAVIVTVAFAPFSNGSIEALVDPGVKWLSIATLTQGFAGIPDAINPVYWSLCYEEQFYIVIALSMMCAAPWRPRLLLTLTAIATVLALTGTMTHIPTGLFVDRWLNFAVGLALFGWFDGRYGRSWSGATLAMALSVVAFTRSPELALSTATVIALLVLRPIDARVARFAPVRIISVLGAMSYSLYLTHVPIAGRVVNGSRRLFDRPDQFWPAVVVAAALVSIGFAALFYRYVERRFVNPRMEGSQALPSAVLLSA